MFHKPTTIFIRLLIILPLLLALGCAGDDERENGLVNIFLVDAPGDFDQVWVEVLGVEITPSNGEVVMLDYIPADKMVNVSALVADNALLVGRGRVPVGEIVQMSLILGDEMYVKTQGEREDMQYASPENRRVDFNPGFNLLGGVSYDFYIDIDLAQSVSKIGAAYFFNPVARTFSNINRGTLSGNVRPVEAFPHIYAISEEDTLTTLINQEGNYTFRGLNQGTYEIRIQPRHPFLDTLFTVPIRVDTLNVAPNIQLRRPAA